MKRLLTALSLVCMLLLTAPKPSTGSDLDYEFWPHLNRLPPAADQEFLRIFLPGETPAFVDLGTLTVEHAGRKWKALQFTRDKNFGETTVHVGKWITGIGGDEWPANTVDVSKEMHATRVVAYEIDGKSHKINPSSFLDLSSPQGTFGLYNVWIRFNEPGTHTLRIVLEQKHDFFFIYPFDVLGTTDPAGLDGRRIFVEGEVVGKKLDEMLVHKYKLNVVR